jgi:3-phosphoshikimate 1-carboxyvinyltransferase
MTTTVWPKLALRGHASVPGSKPHVQRALILSLLTEGVTTIHLPAWSTETMRLLAALEAFGLTVLEDSSRRLTVSGVGRSLRAPSVPVHCGGSAFMFRCMTALACVAEGTTRIVGNQSMKRRPMLAFLNYVQDLGATLRDVSDDTCLAVEIRGGARFGGRTVVESRQSSQFLTALLLVAPLARQRVEITPSHPDAVGEGYVDLTLELMRERGVAVVREGDRYGIEPGAYRAVDFTVPSDFTALSYLAGAALAVPDAEVIVDDYEPSTLSSEREFLDLLGELGLALRWDRGASRLSMQTARRAAAYVDVSGINMPTVATVMAGAAPYVDGTVRIHGIGHINLHKCPRLETMIAQLRRLGCSIDPLFGRDGAMDGFTTSGRQSPAGGVELDSCNDHRVFAGLYVAALSARNPTTIRGAELLHDGYVDFLVQLQQLTRGPASREALARA